MALSLTQTAIDLIAGAGYSGLAAGLIVDSAGIPIPSEVLIAGGVIAAEQGQLNLWWVAAVSTLAQTLGGVIAYLIGQKGEPLLRKYGKYVLISRRDLKLTHDAFAKHGELLAFTGRCVPVVRGYIGFVAGIAGMPFKKFLFATFMGSLAWTAILTWLGLQISNNIRAIDEVVKPFTFAVLAVILVLAAVFVYRRLREGGVHDA